LEHGTVTKSNLNKLICNVAKLKEFSGILGQKDTIQDADEMLVQLEAIMQDLDTTARPMEQNGVLYGSSSFSYLT